MTAPSSSLLDIRSPRMVELKRYLIASVARELEGADFDPKDRSTVVETALNQAYASTKLNLPDSIKEELFHNIMDDLVGFGPIQPLLDDPAITEVMVNGFENVFVERAGKLTKTGITFDNDNEVLKLIDRIILPLGRRIDADKPTVDARLPDGSRVNAVIPPVAIDGPSVTIRKFDKGKLSVEQLINYGTITPVMAELLKACVRTRLNIVVSGGTGTGKTTFLNMLSGYIPHDERIITIEDAAELKLQQEHIVRLETKPAGLDGGGAVFTRDLVRNALRMRPDRIIVGECRGGEALDMLQAMNTGHDGSMTTLHANSPRDALSRLETMCMMAGMEIPLKVIREQIAAAIDMIVQITRVKDGSRKVTAITEVAGMEGDTIVLTDLYKFIITGVSPEGKVLGDMKPTGIRPLFTPRLETAGFKLGPEVFGANIVEFLTQPRRR